MRQVFDQITQDSLPVSQSPSIDTLAGGGTEVSCDFEYEYISQSVAQSVSFPTVAYTRSPQSGSFKPVAASGLHSNNAYNVLVELSFLLVILYLTMHTIRSYRDVIKSFFRSIFSVYLINRLISHPNNLLNFFIRRNLVLLIFLISFFSLDWLPKLFSVGIQNEVWVPLLLLAGCAIVVLSYNGVRMLFMKLYPKDSAALSRIFLFDRLCLALYDIVLLFGVIAQYIYVDGKWVSAVINLLFLLAASVLFYTTVIVCKLFYKEKLSFVRLISYLCATKLTLLAAIVILYERYSNGIL